MEDNFHWSAKTQGIRRLARGIQDFTNGVKLFRQVSRNLKKSLDLPQPRRDSKIHRGL